jgi:aspartyl-tRNA(Asn)/glutamyl-tRNA(Gln) amidotransferase subunit C
MLNQDTITHTAHLAGLYIEASKSEKLQQDLNQILEWVTILQDLDTTQVEPLIHPTEVLNTWVEDIAKAGFTQEEALANAPLKNATHFLVPKVL